ncbi:type II secretion system GspH family protein [bacterium]|nr:type II secretion system GspH family protein [bacterium]
MIKLILNNIPKRSNNNWTLFNSKAFTLIEVVVVTGILAMAIMPIYQMIIGNDALVKRSKFSYMALNLAREELEMIMSVPYDSIDDFKYGWKKIKGPVVTEDLLKVSRSGGVNRATGTLSSSLSGGFNGGSRLVPGSAGQAVIDGDLSVGEGEYPSEYQRFSRKVVIKNKRGKRFKLITVSVKWFGKGSKDEYGGKLYTLSTLVADHRLSALK